MNYIKLLIIATLLIVLVSMISCNESFRESFANIFKSNSKGKENFQNVPTIEQQTEENKKFMNKYIPIEKKTDKINENPYIWNKNNTLETMNVNKNLLKNTGNLYHGSAPEWWYPKDAYNPKNFREIWYSDMYNPIYNYLGNAQEVFYEFKSVRSEDPMNHLIGQNDFN